ncbi:hypothetical protein N7468_002811 [Penicillium chermesinum]|uniref:Uncharacterized protein n=1 Tax=Penicillium chermesinum TaxID=63820 RepID=A0A9W9PLC9_9EURO|nr:uncharacterized protein N7468_002811 [Penicillium chermesinum]KAJ5247828.1 hypothetical protein N7468_002811 [Penicillium chermesinum]
MGKGPLERKLQFDKKNHDLVRLPKYAKVEKRPIPHPPIASPYAGDSVPKVVYVSSGTPFMSAVKRVQKLLHQAEKRATANINLEDTRKTEQQKLAELAKAADKREEILIKATGRAIEKALNVGKWFEEKDTEYSVRVTTGSVLVVDDVVEDENKKKQEAEGAARKQGKEQATSSEPLSQKDDIEAGKSKQAINTASKKKKTIGFSF